MAKKVLYSASTYSHLKNFHLPYLKAFQDAGWETHAVCGGKAMELPYVDKLIHVPFTKNMTSPANLACVRQISKLIREEKYDLVSTHTALAAFFTRLAIPRTAARPRVINTVHGYLFGQEAGGIKRRLLLGAEQITAGVTDLILTMNQEDYATATQYKLGTEIFNTPGMGVSLERFPRQSEASKRKARTELGLEQGDFLLVYAAEFSGRKNQSFLIESLPMLPPQVKLLLLGTGDLWEECKLQAERLGLAARIYFPGHRETLPYLTAADICVSSSHSEGLPFNVMEAMSVGLPVVASNVRGHVDLCTGPAQVGLFSLGDSRAFADVVETLMRKPELYQAISKYGHVQMQQYDIKTVLPCLLEYYGLVEHIQGHRE